MDFLIPPQLTVLDVVGRDAARVLNNLCTAAILPLLEGEGCEAFITEVRGRTLGHVCVYRFADRLRLIGAGGQAATIAAHLDRYTIREDATAEDHSEAWSGRLLDEDCLRQLDPAWAVEAPASTQLLAWRRIAFNVADRSAGRTDSPGGLRSAERSATKDDGSAGGSDVSAGEDDAATSNTSTTSGIESNPAPTGGAIGDSGNLVAYRVPWAGEGRWLVAAPAAEVEKLANWLQANGAEVQDESSFHRQRVRHRFPWFGIDLDDRNLPQEADRDALAISFTKGCYLGQETVARLDALGQVQKKLVQWRIRGSEQPAAGTELSHDGRVVGRLTSAVTDPAGEGYLALGFARRSHFEAGAEAQMQHPSGETVLATVI